MPNSLDKDELWLNLLQQKKNFINCQTHNQHLLLNWLLGDVFGTWLGWLEFQAKHHGMILCHVEWGILSVLNETFLSWTRCPDQYTSKTTYHEIAMERATKQEEPIKRPENKNISWGKFQSIKSLLFPVYFHIQEQ